MTKLRIAHLLDDFALGGVSRGLEIFTHPAIGTMFGSRVVGVGARAVWAPRCHADIIVTHLPPNWRRLALMASLRLANPGARLLHVEHSYTRAWETRSVAHLRRFRTMLAIAMRLADEVVCVSQAQAQWLAEAAGLPAERIAVIYPYSANPGLGALPLPDFAAARPRRIGAYGRFHPIKGFDRLIAAFRAGAMPGCELMIGGYGAEEAALRAAAAGCAAISFYGKVTDVADFIGQCDVIAIPSHCEAYGQVANEAREGGRPILVSPVDGLPEQVGGAGLVVDFADHAAVARSFATLNPARLLAMAWSGRAATAGCHQARAEQWAQLLRQLAAGLSRRQPALAKPDKSTLRDFPQNYTATAPEPR